MSKSLTINRQREQLNILVLAWDLLISMHTGICSFFALQLSSSQCNMSLSLVGMNVNQINLENTYSNRSGFMRGVFFFLEETETYHYYINISIISYYFHLKHRGLNRFHRGHAAYILLYTNKGCNDQRSQATTSSVSGLKKIL